MPKTVLLVDDEPLLLKTNARFLERLGYKVLMATDGEEALKVFKENADRISLSLLDWMMPRLNGLGAIRKLRELKPDLPVILSSGHPAAEALQDLSPGEEIRFIQKPYSMKVLRQAIDSVLK